MGEPASKDDNRTVITNGESAQASTRATLSVVTSAGAKPGTSADKSITYLVRALVKYNASDLHIKVGRPPLFRINGRLVPAKMSEFTAEQAEAAVFSVLTERQREDLEKKRQVDASFFVKDLGRFRLNVFYQRGHLSAAIRLIPFKVPRLAELGMPEVLTELCQRPRGLLLITGSTGSGKSTTLAAVVQYINENSNVHILTIEDPIEFVHADLKASISQREVGSDTNSLQEALFGGLRQDPDVIMIGEMRDCAMIQGALTAAETGHLVLSTLHTNDAKSTIDRIVDVFPADAKNQVRVQLAACLLGVVSQQLLVRADGKGRVPACEILIKSPTIEDHIRTNQLDKIPEAIAASGNYYKMQTMNMALERLVLSGTVEMEEALRNSNNPDDLRLRFSGMNRSEGFAATGEGPEIERIGR